MWFIIWFLACLLVAHFASKKGHTGILYFFISMILSPLIGAILVLIAKDKKDELNIKNKVNKKCSKCAEIIKYEAVKCRFCGEPAE